MSHLYAAVVGAIMLFLLFCFVHLSEKSETKANYLAAGCFCLLLCPTELGRRRSSL